MVRAILDGTKTQTRRIIKPQPDWLKNGVMSRDGLTAMIHNHACPYGKPTDQLWVKETSRLMIGSEESVIQYRADMAIQDLPDGWYSNDPVLYRWIASQSENPKRWRPSILMPQRASRITLEVTGIRVERLQAISEADAKAEGCMGNCPVGYIHAHQAAPLSYEYAQLWESINGPGSWDANPFVWVIEFNRIKP